MADENATTLPTSSGGDRTPLAGRGSTTIADRVLEQLARRVALEVPGVVRHSSGGLGPLGSSLPTSSVERGGDRARLALTVAVLWDVPAPVVVAELRDTVRRRLGELTGTTIDRVDVTVAALVPESRRKDSTEKRRVQ